MSNIKLRILSEAKKQLKDKTKPRIISPFKLKTTKANQLLAFFKPETFFPNTKTENLIDLVFKKFSEFEVSIDGAALFAGPALHKHSIMDRHYGVINQMSKSASKLLIKDDYDLVYRTLGIKNKSTPILGGHEAYAVSGFRSTQKFDNYWLEAPSTKVKSGTYARVLTIANKSTVVINGFHPNQLDYYTNAKHQIIVLLASSNTPWKKLREEMLGEAFPEKAPKHSIRGAVYKDKKDYGFDSVSIANNILHLSAGPTEALFEIDNFLTSLGLDLFTEKAKLASELTKIGLDGAVIKKIMNNKSVHAELEHKDTDYAINFLKRLSLS